MNTALLKKTNDQMSGKKTWLFPQQDFDNQYDQSNGRMVQEAHSCIYIAARASDVLSPSSLFGSPLSIGADSGNFGGDLSSGSAPCQHQQTRLTKRQGNDQ